MTARSAPPPLRKSKPPSPAGKGSAPPLRRVDDQRDVGDELERSGAALQPPDGDDDPTKGEWLFKQNEMVLGPVTAIVLVERIKAGELSADTPIARDGQPFKPMKLVALFREAHEATLERKKREAEERRYNAAVRRARTLRVFIFATIILVPAAAGAVGGHMVMKLQPWDKTAEWIAKAPPLVDLPPRPPEVVKKNDALPPPNDNREDVVASNDTKRDVKDRPRLARAERDKGKKDDDKGKKDDKKDDPKEDEKKDDGKDQGFVKELTNEQAVAPLKSSAVKGALGSCFKAELEANPDMPAQLILAYTITEEGRSANVELTNRELRGRPVQDCVKKAMGNARWPRFEGERKNVSVPFNIKKPKPPPTVGGAVQGTPK